ncbi:DUF547 domain-containing protein [Nonlabens arenilitoris]|uniref:DUF547 domain-containing protein n=1 Tax=Nonlabens arenilitoris TaxID=1217969 RepID=A0A2S7U7K3_9FLAO|nr:DUF547 domain-containing protein [Nonlabens arenilitoris]PQJ30560.1 DUF547 domain-containing protein [Nonlabens arenilitoris]
MKTILSILIMISLSTTASGIGNDQFYKEANVFLQTHVKNGLVDYDAIAKEPTQLNKLIDMIINAQVDSSNSQDYQAFYINAYNLYVIKGIVDDKLSSPLDKKGFFDSIKRKVAGESLTLNDIENKKLRATFHDARFHFVLVCGALGCPPLINQVYSPVTLEKQLEQQTIKALNNNEFIQVKKNRVAVSQIFEWYQEDFIASGKSILEFISKYRKQALPENAKLSFYTYNWKVNKQ